MSLVPCNYPLCSLPADYEIHRLTELSRYCDKHIAKRLKELRQVDTPFDITIYPYIWNTMIGQKENVSAKDTYNK